MKREFPHNPIVAVGGVILKNEKVLLVKRQNPPDKSMWSIPGGAVELGETLSEAVQREINEECGINVDNGQIIAVIDKIYSAKSGILYHYEIVDFEFKDFIGTPYPGSDALDIRFFTFNEALNCKTVATSVKELIEKIYIHSIAKKSPLYLTYRI